MACNSPSKSILLVNTGTSNIASILNCIERCNGIPCISEDPDLIAKSDYVVVPGVGSFGQTMNLLNSNNIRDALKFRFFNNLPTLLICVGLQACAASSEESPGASGLGLFGKSSAIKKFPNFVSCPQQGWNLVYTPSTAIYACEGYNHCYFSNSYVLPSVPSGWLAYTSFHGIGYVAALEMGSWLACQFHPELSGEWGVNLISNWIQKSIDNIKKIDKNIIEIPNNPDIDIGMLRGYSNVGDMNTNLTRRIIPCLDTSNGKVFKGIKFQNLKFSGFPDVLAERYQQSGADELVMLDISATVEERKTNLDTIKNIRKFLSIPLTVGGGISTLDDAKMIMAVGADKISINSGAVKNPQLIDSLAKYFGNQCVVLAIDALKVENKYPYKWNVLIESGNINTGKDVIEWAVEGVNRGAGEILLTSLDRDGTKSGYDLDLIKAISSAVKVPVVASGGAATVEHIKQGLNSGANAVLAASIFHDQECTPNDIKRQLANDLKMHYKG